MSEYLVRHIESNFVEADSREEAVDKAIRNETESVWDTEGYEPYKIDSAGKTPEQIVEDVADVIEKYDDLDHEMDMDSAITMIRRMVID